MAVFGGAYLYSFDGHRSPTCEAPSCLAFALSVTFRTRLHWHFPWLSLTDPRPPAAPTLIHPGGSTPAFVDAS